MGCWFDYDLVKKHLRKDFYPSNVVPLWAGAQQSDSTVKRVINYLRTVGALDYPGGIPTSLKQTGNAMVDVKSSLVGPFETERMQTLRLTA